MKIEYIIGDRREKQDRREKKERRKINSPTEFSDRRMAEDRRISLERRLELSAVKKKKVVILGISQISENRVLAEHLKKMIKERELSDFVSVEHSIDLVDFLKHGVILAPGVVVNGKLKSAGRTPNKEEIKIWLDELHENIQKLSDNIDEFDDEILTEMFEEF